MDHSSGTAQNGDGATRRIRRALSRRPPSLRPSPHRAGLCFPGFATPSAPRGAAVSPPRTGLVEPAVTTGGMRPARAPARAPRCPPPRPRQEPRLSQRETRAAATCSRASREGWTDPEVPRTASSSGTERQALLEAVSVPGKRAGVAAGRGVPAVRDECGTMTPGGVDPAQGSPHAARCPHLCPQVQNPSRGRSRAPVHRAWAAGPTRGASEPAAGQGRGLRNNLRTVPERSFR